MKFLQEKPQTMFKIKVVCNLLDIKASTENNAFSKMK